MSFAVDSLGSELDYLRDNLVEAIKQEKTGFVKEGLDTYYELIHAFLEEMKQWGSPYLAKQAAMEEVGSLEGGWSEIEWIRRDIFEIIDVSLSTDNVNILSEVLYFPIKLATLAFSELDYYIFHHFITAVPYAYGACERVRDPQAARFVVDRSWRHLVEMSNFIIGPELERGRTVEELETKGQFALAPFVVFSNLLKGAYDHGRPSDAATFSGALGSLFEFYIRRAPDLGLVTGLEPDELRHDLDVVKAHGRLLDAIKLRKSLVPYGLHAWILSEFDTGEIGDPALKEWRASVPMGLDWSRNWEVFLKAREHEMAKEFGWDWWDFNKRAGPEAVFVGYGGFERHLELFWVIESLRLLGEMTPDQHSNAVIRPSEEVLYLAGGPEDSIMKVIDTVETASSKWTPILGPQGIASVAVLRGQLEEAVRLQRDREVQEVIYAQLSPERVQEVKRNVLEKWKETAIVRAIVQDFGDYMFSEDPPAGVGYFGINILDRKDVYVAESRVYGGGWGEEYGRGLGQGENDLVMRAIISAIPKFAQDIVTPDSLSNQLDLAISDLVRRGYDPALLILDSWWLPQRLTESPQYKHPGEDPVLWLSGFWNDRPIVSLRHVGFNMKPLVVVVDLKRIGVWHQFRPKKVFESEEYISPELSFYTSFYDSESVRKLLREQPDFLRAKDGKERKESEVLMELLQRVHLRVVEQFEFKIKDESSGFQISIRAR